MEKTTHQQTLTRACLRDALHNQLRLPVDIAAVILESILKEISHLITKGEYLKIVGFGTFLIHEKKARIGRNPKTKEEKLISPRKSVSFRASMNLRQMVDKKAEGSIPIRP